MDAIIDHAISHDTVFHQFMLYSPVPNTPLYEKHKQNDTLLSEYKFSHADAYGQYRFNYCHPHIKDERKRRICWMLSSVTFLLVSPSTS
ncbi:MAG: hypothetical protein A4E69_01129 [Syntrophus sp. PtaB.Bin138]|nr:MAG: hypothetical protein A4E69_01129 [Syntrophus sp. PtaB.Bin138]